LTEEEAKKLGLGKFAEDKEEIKSSEEKSGIVELTEEEAKKLGLGKFIKEKEMEARKKENKMQAEIDEMNKELEIEDIEKDINKELGIEVIDSVSIEDNENENEDDEDEEDEEDSQKLEELYRLEKEIDMDGDPENELPEIKEEIERLYNKLNASIKSEMEESFVVQTNGKNVHVSTKNLSTASETEINKLKLNVMEMKLQSELKKKEYNLSAAPKVKEKEQDISKLPVNMETTEFKEYKNRPKDITPEQKDSAIDAPQHIKDEFKELKKTIDDTIKLNLKYEEELSKLKNKYETPITEKSKKNDSILKDIYHQMADIQRVNNIVKLSNEVYLGVVEKIEPISNSKSYTEEELKKINVIKDQIKGMKEKLNELQKELGRYTENIKEIKVFSLEASMSEVEIQAAAIEEQEIMKENESILDNIANQFRFFFNTLKEISINLAVA
jgi:hypothetical protein